MTAIVLLALLAASPGAAPPVPAEARPARREPVAVAGAADARRVCEAAALPEGTEPSGGLLERAEAEERHAEQRGDALAARYQAVFPGERLRFAAYDPGERVLALQRHAPLLTGDGGLRLDPLDDVALPVEADGAAVKRVLAAQQARTLALRVTFELESEDEPCFHVPGARTWTVSGTPIAWEYVAGETVLARGGEGADRPPVSAKAGAKPHVRLGTSMEEESAKALRGVVQGRVGDLEGCYSSALDRDPWIDGAIVADLETRGRGRPERVRIAADSTNDERLVSCVREILASLELPAGRAFLPIHFELEPN